MSASASDPSSHGREKENQAEAHPAVLKPGPDGTPFTDFLARAIAAHRAMGLTFSEIFDEYFCYHYFIKGPNYFLLARTDPNHPDAWLVYWADMYPVLPRLQAIRFFLDLAPYDRKFVAWARLLKGRTELKYYSTARLRRLTNLHPA